MPTLWEPTSTMIDTSCVESADALAWCTVPEDPCRRKACDLRASQQQVEGALGVPFFCDLLSEPSLDRAFHEQVHVQV